MINKSTKITKKLCIILLCIFSFLSLAGVKYDRGLPGEQGPPGKQGEQGLPGEKGEQGPPGVTVHNDLSSLDGGKEGEYYHLTYQQHIDTTRLSTMSDTGLLSPVDYIYFASKQNTLVPETGIVIDENNKISLNKTSVTPGSYTLTGITVDSEGRITSAVSGSESDTLASVTSRGATTSQSLSLTGSLSWEGSNKNTTITMNQNSVIDGDDMSLNVLKITSTITDNTSNNLSGSILKISDSNTLSKGGTNKMLGLEVVSGESPTWNYASAGDVGIEKNLEVQGTVYGTFFKSSNYATDSDSGLLSAEDHIKFNKKIGGSGTYGKIPKFVGEKELSDSVMNETMLITRHIGVNLDPSSVSETSLLTDGICLVPFLSDNITVKNVSITLNTSSYDIMGDIKYADKFIGKANSSVISSFDTTSGELVNKTVDQQISSGKTIYIIFDSVPNDTVTQCVIDITYIIRSTDE